MQENKETTEQVEYVSTWQASRILGYPNSAAVRGALYSGKLNDVRKHKNSHNRWMFAREDLESLVQDDNFFSVDDLDGICTCEQSEQARDQEAADNAYITKVTTHGFIDSLSRLVRVLSWKQDAVNEDGSRKLRDGEVQVKLADMPTDELLRTRNVFAEKLSRLQNGRFVLDRKNRVTSYERIVGTFDRVLKNREQVGDAA